MKRNNYDNIKILEGVAGDNTGIINFRVTDKNAEFVENNIGKTLAFRNIRSEVIGGFHRIRIDLWGKITPSAINIGEINPYVRNLSAIEYVKKPLIYENDVSIRNYRGNTRGGHRNNGYPRINDYRRPPTDHQRQERGDRMNHRDNIIDRD